MNLAILSVQRNSYSTKRLRQAAVQREHKVRILNTKEIAMSLESGYPDIYYRGKRLAPVDAILPRIGASITSYGTAVVRQFEQMGVYSANSAASILNSRDKLRSLQILSRHSVGIAATSFVRERADIKGAISRVGGAPVVIKLVEGTQGIGVILAEDEKMAEAILETLQSADQHALVQKFVSESRGTDVRAFVIGDRVVAGMRRRAQGNEFRSNVHRGGRTEMVDLPEAYAKTAVRAAQILGLRVAGVDLLESESGPLIMEVNSSPGLEGIERATGLDIADEIIRSIEDQLNFPELDVHQRLTQVAGYGVAEFTVHKESELVGTKLRDARLQDRDIMVLKLERGEVIKPSPRGDDDIQVGDHLLCYGRLSEMRTLIGPKKRKRRVRKLAR